jgi:hypothetical protein
LSPIVTDGLPTPGPLVAEEDVDDVELLAAGVLDDELLEVLLLPHATSARLASAAASATSARMLTPR